MSRWVVKVGAESSRVVLDPNQWGWFNACSKQITNVSHIFLFHAVHSDNNRDMREVAAPEMMSTSEINSSPMTQTVSSTPIIIILGIAIPISIIISALTTACILKTNIFSPGDSCKSCWTSKKQSIESDSMLNLREHDSTEHEARITEIEA